MVQHKWEDRFSGGVWLGKTTRSDDHIIFDGMEAKRCRTLQRQPDGLRWQKEKVLAIDVYPWKMKSDRCVRLKEPRFPRRYITPALISKYGPTAGCKACSVEGPVHSDECRARFEELIAKEEAEEQSRRATQAAAKAACESKGGGTESSCGTGAKWKRKCGMAS